MELRLECFRFQVEHEKKNPVSTSNHVLFCLLYLHTNDDSFDDFPKISEHFPNIVQQLSEGQKMVSEHFIRKFSKISEEETMLFRSYRNTSKYFLRERASFLKQIQRVRKYHTKHFPCCNLFILCFWDFPPQAGFHLSLGTTNVKFCFYSVWVQAPCRFFKKLV